MSAEPKNAGPGPWSRNLWRRLFRDEVFRDQMRFFRKVILFRGLSDRLLSRLVHTIMEKTYAEKDLIFQEGDVGRAMFIVAEGRVRLFQNGKKNGPPETIAEIGPGEFFGEMVLLDELPRSASAEALESTRLYILYKSNFDGLLTDAPDVASKVLHTLARLLSARLRRENFNSTSVNYPGR
ncbi:MAG TPA: cyclic nucleotide-binding domain-containing protein [Elusimicrobiota bacterium]|nr:cyclic nucleotide-binding domain-containing protein [Elusimicrobiota bacterium]